MIIAVTQHGLVRPMQLVGECTIDRVAGSWGASDNADIHWSPRIVGISTGPNPLSPRITVHGPRACDTTWYALNHDQTTHAVPDSWHELLVRRDGPNVSITLFITLDNNNDNDDNNSPQ